MTHQLSPSPLPGGQRRPYSRPRVALNPRQARFVDEYLVDLNATQAAIRAGYSAKTAEQTASRLLRNVKVAAAVDAAKEARKERTQTLADRTVAEIARIAFSRMRWFARWGPSEQLLGRSAVTLTPSDELTDDADACVAEISEGPHGVKLKLHPKPAALRLLCEHLGILKEPELLEKLLGSLPESVGREVRAELGRLLSAGAAPGGSDPAPA